MKGEVKKYGRCPMQKIIILFFALCLFPVISSSAFAKKPKIYTPEDQYKYQQQALRQEEKEKYERSLLPQSGYMTREEYEELSREIPSYERKVPDPEPPKDIKMKYIPQPVYKLGRYNNPPGSPELHIDISLKYDREFICPGITSPNKDIVVYPKLSYYAASDCTVCDLFVIPLDKTLPELSRIQRANIINRLPEPILSTEKDIREKCIFRTITPIDFSPDGSKLLAKEKIGNINDGIWQTNVLVYDFNKKTARKIPEIREAIKFYWKNNGNLILNEKRWDIYPLGFDANNPERIVVSSYGYTGGKPNFLGTWSIDCQGERSLLISLFKENVPISINGYKLVKEGYVDPVTVYNNEKQKDKLTKKKRKEEKKAKKQEAKEKKQVLNKKLKEMKQEEKTVLKEYRKKQNSSFPTGSN